MDKRFVNDVHFPIAQLMLRASKSISPTEMHTNAMYLAEMLLKLSAIVRLSIVQSNRDVFQSYLSNIPEILVKPSLGHWLMIFRESAIQLEKSKLAIDYEDILRTDKRIDLPAVRAWAEECSKIPSGPFEHNQIKGQLKNGLMGFFELIVNYRNKTTGHGALLPPAQLEKTTSLFLNAIQEALEKTCCLSSIKLVFAELKVIDNRNQIEWLFLHGPASFRLSSSQMPLVIENKHEKIAGKVYALIGNNLICMHPLVYYSNDGNLKEQFAFFNDIRLTAGKRIASVNYTDYAYGENMTLNVPGNRHVSCLLSVDGEDDASVIMSVPKKRILAEFDNHVSIKPKIKIFLVLIWVLWFFLCFI